MGMTVDRDGNLWVAIAGAGEIRCYTPEELFARARVSVATPTVTSCAFGGIAGTDLFITTARVKLPAIALSGLTQGFSLEVGASREPGAGGLYVLPARPVRLARPRIFQVRACGALHPMMSAANCQGSSANATTFLGFARSCPTSLAATPFSITPTGRRKKKSPHDATPPPSTTFSWFLAFCETSRLSGPRRASWVKTSNGPSSADLRAHRVSVILTVNWRSPGPAPAPGRFTACRRCRHSP